MRNASPTLSLVLNHLVLIVVALYFLAPLAWLLSAAVRPHPSLTLALAPLSLQNFARLFRGDTLLWIRNSLVIALATTAITVTVAFLAAYPLARYDFRGKTAMLMALVLSMTMPLSTVMVPTFDLARLLHLRNTRLGVALIVATRLLPLAIWVLKEFITTVPGELEEAAALDGAGWLTILRTIVLPLARPGLAVVGLVAFVNGWGDFIVSLILIDHEPLSPISMGIFHASLAATSTAEATVDYGVMAAISLLYLWPPLLAFLGSQRYIIHGMVLGAVKQ